MTVWKWVDKNFKIYTEDLETQNQLKKFSKFKLHSEYFKNGKKIAEDFIFPANRLKRLKKLAAENGVKIKWLQ